MTPVLALPKSLAGDFWRWWTGELASLVPGGVRRVVAPPRKRAILEIAGSDAVLWQEGGRARRQLARIALEDGHPADRMQATLRKLDPRATEIVLRIAADLALRKTVTLPRAAEEDLRRVLSYELDRLTPFKAGEALFDCRIERHDPGAGKIEVALTVVPKPTVDHALDLARRLGLEAETVDVAAPTPDAPVSGDLLAGSARARRSGRLPLLLAVTAGSLALAGLYLPLERQREVAAALSGEVGAVRKQLDAAERLEKEVAALVQDRNFLAVRKQQRYPAIAVLNELTRLLPDDTYLLQCDFNGEQVQLSGFSPSASALIARIEDSPLFANTAFRSPVMLDPRVGRERFQISADVARQGGS